MRVMNVMLSDGLGGLEHAFLHYTHALRVQGCEVVSSIRRGAKIQSVIAAEYPVAHIISSSERDPRAIWQAHRTLKKYRPDVILAHGRRALVTYAWAKRLFRHKQPIAVVLHGPRFKFLHYADHVIAVGKQLREQAIAHGIAPQKVTHIPNFLLEESPVREAPSIHHPPAIGVLGRFAPVKGFDLFLEALALLKQRGIAFRAVIGGAGKEEAALRAQASAAGLDAHITWTGWLKDTRTFYEKIDIFCSPSRREAFGLSLLDAMHWGKIIVATATLGSCELVEDQYNGLLCDISATALADTLAIVMTQLERARTLATHALKRADAYRLLAIAPQIKACLDALVAPSVACARD